jgi:hypothetical protein
LKNDERGKIMIAEPLTREDIISVIEGKGRASRIPNLVQLWVHPTSFGDRQPAVEKLLETYPTDVQRMRFNIPDVFDAPADDPSYRWVNFDDPHAGEQRGIDEVIAIEDMEKQLAGVLADFPDPEYPGLFSDNPAADGRYRLGNWFYFMFERFWSLRGMTNGMMDFYIYPDEVHELFEKMTVFYCRIIERAVEECQIDGIFTSDDLGTQASTFFSPEIFDTFFAPYYKRVIDTCHRLGIHFWLHTCGNIEKFIPRFIELGIDVLHPIQKYTMEEKIIADSFGKDICIFAGFDVQQIIPWGTPEEVRKEVHFMMDTYYRPEGHLMLTAGNGVNEDCSLESLEALLDETFKYGKEICGSVDETV